MSNKSTNSICLGVGIVIVIIVLICLGSSMLNSDNADHSATLVINGKEFTLNNLTNAEIDNINGNNTNSIRICDKEGHYVYGIEKVTNDTTLLNDLNDNDNVSEVEYDGISYKNIIFSDGNPSMTIFTTNDGSIYEITYFNGNDFTFDYHSLGNQLNSQ